MLEISDPPRVRRHRPGRRLALVAALAVVTLGGWAAFEATGGPGPSLSIEDGVSAASAPASPAAAGTRAGAPAGAPDPQDAAAARRPAATGASSPRPAPPGAAATPGGGLPSSSIGGSIGGLPVLPFAQGALVSWPDLTDVRHDQGNSVPLPDGRSLWVFADTTQTTRAPYFFVTSSGAVSKRGSTRLTYAANGRKVPVEFLPRTAAERATQQPGKSYTAVWPTGATKLPDGRIVIGYAKYAVTLNPASYTFQSAGLYEYRYRGVSSLRKATPAKRIADGIWQPADGVVGSPVAAGGYVYFAQCGNANLECYSLRTTPAGLTDRSTYTWWTGTGWSADRGARAPMAYGASRPGLTPSMAYLPAMGVYATTGTAAGHTAQTGLLWVAPHPWGPWSKPASFTLPGCPAAGCYTLNLHPSESGPERVRISYATAGVGPYVHVTDVSLNVAANGRTVTLR